MSMQDVWAAEEGGGGMEPGIYLAEVRDAEKTHAQTSGNAMFSFKMCVPGGDRVICYERIMLAGSKESLGISKTKLKTLGVADGKEIDADDLNGRRVFIATKLGKANKDGRQFLEVNISARGSKCGYWPESQPPADVPVATPAKPDDDVPW